MGVALATQLLSCMLRWQRNIRNSPPFQQSNLGVCAALVVLTHEDVVFGASDAVAATVGFFNLVAPVGGVVVKEFQLVAVDGVLHVDERALQHEEVVDARHILDAQCIDLID